MYFGSFVDIIVRTLPSAKSKAAEKSRAAKPATVADPKKPTYVATKGNNKSGKFLNTKTSISSLENKICNFFGNGAFVSYYLSRRYINTADLLSECIITN